MEKSALTNGNQHRTALDVALSGGITSEQFTDLCQAAVQHMAFGLGNTPTLRLQNVRYLIREGLITRDSVNGFIENLRAQPRDVSLVSVILIQLAEIGAAAAALSDVIQGLSDDDAACVATIHEIITRLATRVVPS